MEIDFTVVVPALNIKPSLELVLRCLEAQSYSRDRFECIVVDDGSTDDTREFLANYKSSLQFTRVINTSCQGRGAARNIGWRSGHGAAVVFLDGDTLPSPQWLSDYAKAFALKQYDVVSGGRYCIDVDPKETGLQQRLAICAETGTEELFKVEVGRQFSALHRAAALGPYRQPAFEKFERQLREACLACPESLLVAYSFVGANVAVLRSFLEKTNGFDQFLRRGEDTDLGIRLWEIGARFGYADGANAYHQAGAGELNRNLDPVEAMTFFYRNPYRLVLLVYLWFMRQFARPAEGGHPALEDLKTLAGQGSDHSDLDIDAEFQRLRQPPIPADCRHTREELVEYYVDTFGVPPSFISAFLEHSVAQGLYTKKQDGRRLFDFSLISNWLRYRAPLHEYLLLKGNCFRQYKNMFFPVRKAPVPRVLTCRGAYEIAIDANVLTGHEVRALANIPLPVENPSQNSIKFTHCYPADLLNHSHADGHTIPRYPWPTDQPEVRLGYEFEFVVKEDVGRSTNENAKALRESWREYGCPALSPRDYPKAKMLLRKIGVEKYLKPYDVAKRIYYWILENTCVNEGPSGRSNILDSGFGMCVDHARLFINLCRLAGIPARERCGALFGLKVPGDERETFETKTICFSPFMHTWAEAHIGGQGWIPVDFCVWAYGKRIVTQRNVCDPELRKEIMAETNSYDEYYFGNVDPYRVHAGEQANHVHVSFEHVGSPGLPGWRKRTCIKHRLKCSVLQTQ